MLFRSIEEGITAPEAIKTVQLWAVERDTQDELDAIRDRQPTRTNLKDWLKDNIITTAEWLQGMEDLGYDDLSISRFFDEIIIETGGGEQLALDVIDFPQGDQ